MKSDSKHYIFWTIVYVIFLICLLTLLIFGVLSILNPEILEVYQPKYQKVRVIEPESVEITLETEANEPLVSESRQGVDLYRFYIAQIHEQYYPAVDPYIALAVLEVESNYQPTVMSSAGAVGLMQVIPKYHLRRVEKYGLNDIWDPYTNIICGMDLLNELITVRGNWSQALLGYNNSSAYVKAILQRADALRETSIFT